MLYKCFIHPKLLNSRNILVFNEIYLTHNYKDICNVIIFFKINFVCVWCSYLYRCVSIYVCVSTSQHWVSSLMSCHLIVL